jgi:hypothetical protein
LQAPTEILDAFIEEPNFIMRRHAIQFDAGEIQFRYHAREDFRAKIY